jgi:hypothetical protein
VQFRKVVKRSIREVRDGVKLAAEVNATVAANVAEKRAGTASRTSSPPEQRGAGMAEQSEYRSVSREELEQIAGEQLPERAAMSLVNANIAIPINAAVAANVLSDGAIAYADAAQTTPIDQSN